MLVHNIGEQLKSLEEYTGELVECSDLSPDRDTCIKRWSQLAVYRVFFGATLFFTFMALLMFRVRSTMDIRAGFQNGFWLIKILMWIGLTVAAFYIDNIFFQDTWGYIGIVGAFFFMLIEGVYIIIFANMWQKNFVNAEGNGGCARCCVPFTTLLLFIANISISVVLFVYYTYGSSRGGCHTNKGLISFNLIMVFLLAFFSVASKAEERGLLQASVVSFYTTYLTWSAVANTVDSCQPDDYDASEWLTSTIGFALAIFVIGGISNLSTSSEEGQSSKEVTETTDVEGRKILLVHVYNAVDNEKESVYYNWSVFHATLALGCMYMMNVLSHWATIHGSIQANPSEVDVANSEAPVWVQAAASWIAMMMYLWSIGAPYLGPKLCPCRDWPEIEG